MIVCVCVYNACAEQFLVCLLAWLAIAIFCIIWLLLFTGSYSFADIWLLHDAVNMYFGAVLSISAVLPCTFAHICLYFRRVELKIVRNKPVPCNEWRLKCGKSVSHIKTKCKSNATDEKAVR